MFDIAIRFLLISLIIVSCLVYGSVTNLGLFITEILIIIVILAWFTDTVFFKRALSFEKIGSLVFFIVFLGFVCFQILPLPLNVIKVISPKTIELYKNFLPPGASSTVLTLSIYPQDTLSELFKVIGYLAVFVLVANKFETKKQLDMIINTVILFGFLISLFGIIQKYTYAGKVYWFDPVSSAGNPFGPFANRNSFSGYINMIIPLTLGYLLTDMPLSKRLVYGIFILIMSLALFLSLSRGGVIIYLATIIFLLFLSAFKSGLRSSSRMLSVGIILVCFIYIFLGEAKVAWQRVSSLFCRESFIVLGHGYSWLDTFRICKDFPFFGTGLGTFGSISSMYKTNSDQILFTYAHNDYLQLLSETGLVGFVSVLLFFIFYFFSVLKNWFQRRDSYVVCVVLGGIASAFSILLYSLLDFNLQIPATALLFFVILGLVYRLSCSHFDHARPIS